MIQPSRTTIGQRKRILLVDDEPALTSGLVRALMDEPYVFFTAESGSEALEILANEPIDVIVSDDKMPGMQGTELLARVRQHYPLVVRLILTGNASVESAMKAIHDGWVYQYLHKPCHPADLAVVLHNALMLRSLTPIAEYPHICMEGSEQERLLASVGGAQGKTLELPGAVSYVDIQWTLD
jgi:DNA-binding NtrC family response regulator